MLLYTCAGNATTLAVATIDVSESHVANLGVSGPVFHLSLARSLLSGCPYLALTSILRKIHHGSRSK